jgi:Tfp pilus assembly protein PilN
LAINEKRDLKGEELLKITKQQIDTTSNLIKNHTYWTQGLYKIASLIQNEVQVESLSVTDKISLNIVASNYATVAKQIASFIYDDSIKDVEIGKIDPSANGLLGLSITLTFDEAKLIKKTKTEL